MDKRDFFMLCMNEGKYRLKPWVIRAFSLVRETKKVEEIAFYDILQTPAGFFYKSPDTGALEPITGANMKPGQPMFNCKEKLTVKKGELPGILKDEETDYGRILYHCMIFVYSFGNKVPFQNKQLNMRAFEDELASRLDDDVMLVNSQGGAQLEEKPDRFYPRELNRYYEAMAYSRGMAMLFVPAASPKSLTVDPIVLKRRNELFSDPNIDMNNQAVAAQVEKELVDLDKKTFEGDPASGYLISGKNWASRKKCFISFGSGDSLTPDSRTPYVKTSLDEGTDITQFKAYNDEMRTGSYKRGVETMFGGELDKWLVRESSNIRVQEDCGSTVGIPTEVTDFNKVSMLGKFIVAGKQAVKLTEDNIGTYMGKVVLRRSPAACWTGMPDYCRVCLGDKLSMNPDAISIAFSQYGHDFMGESMSAMHGKSLSIARMDLVSEAS
jgi:hypothetical protein